MKSHEVFGISSKILMNSYVNRSNLDESFSILLERNTHIVVKGASKCGKTWLRQRNIGDSIVVPCRIGWTIEDIYGCILENLDIKILQKEIIENTYGHGGNLCGKVKLPFLEIGSEAQNENGNATKQEFSHSINVFQNINFIANAIKNSGKRIVIEDFHYLSPDTRKRFSYDLKLFWDLEVFFIIIGVWTQSNMLIFLNPDLSGRVEEIVVEWSKEELIEVAQKGSKVLNISFSDELLSHLAQSCYGSVGLFQNIILKILDRKQVYRTQNEHFIIDDITLLHDVCIVYAESLRPLYEQFAKKISEGIRKRDDNTGIYAHAMKAIFSFTDEELIKGVSRDAIYKRAHAIEPRIQSGNLHTVLCKFESLQIDHENKGLIISYNEITKEVSIIDRQVLFYRTYITVSWPWDDIIKEKVVSNS